MRDIEGIFFKKVNELICVLKCVCGKRTFRDMEDIFKKVNYIYISASECVLEGEKKKEQNLLFKEKEPFGQERKNQFKQGKVFN